MHPGKMAEIGKVLDLPGGVRLPSIGPGRHDCPAVIFQFGNLWQRPSRLLQGNPDDAVAFLNLEYGNPRLGGYPGGVLQLRNRHAPAIGSVAPAMVGADDLIAADPAEREGSAP